MIKLKKAEPNATDVRLRRLISNGYFPSELPPPFTTEKFAEHAVHFAGQWNGEKIRDKFWSRPESYSMPRYGHARRMLSIVNPVNQLHVSHLISQNWDEIHKRLKRSTITEFDPQLVLQGPGRAVTGVNFDGVARRRAEILGSYGRYVKTDIARFYPSIYTHAIPWAIFGKDHVKKNHKDPAFKNSFGNYLDRAIASGQQGQTIGIPIGPDSSRILSELIASEIEVVVSASIPNFERRSVRYVDDMLLGLEEHETPSAVLSHLSAALYDFELELNAEKTVTNGIGCSHSPEWIHYIRTFELTENKDRQRGDLDSFFEQALHLADANPRDNVLLYAAKRAASFKLNPSNLAHLVRWLLYCSRRSPSCLSFVAEHLAAGHQPNADYNREVQDYILQQIPLKAEASHTEEVAWLLFWAIQIGLRMPARVLEKASSLRSSVVGLLSLDLRQRGLLTGLLDLSTWRSAANSDGLRSEMWLIAYEATKKGWWPIKQSSGYITGHPYFGDLWKKGIEFYDPAKKARPTVERKFFPSPGFGPFYGSSDYLAK